MREASFIAEHLVRGVQSCSFFNCRRINFICRSQDLRKGVRNYAGISEMDVLFNPEYFLLSLSQKEHYLYSLLYSALSDLCAVEKWDFSLFQSLFQEIKSNQYSCCFYTNLRRKRNGICARLFGIQRIDKLSFYIEFTRMNNPPSRQFLFDSKPNAFDYDRFLGRLEWTSAYEIALIGKDNHEISVVAIRTEDKTADDITDTFQ